MSTITAQPETRKRAASPARALAPATTTRAIDSDVALFLLFFVGVLVGVWAVNDGWNSITHDFWRGAASLSGILTSACALVGLLLATRLPWMERSLGLDRVLIWHRIAGD